MKTFNFKAVYSQLLTPEIVFRLTQLHEYKGRLNRLLETDAAALSEIKETAALQTVAASNLHGRHHRCRGSAEKAYLE